MTELKPHIVEAMNEARKPKVRAQIRMADALVEDLADLNPELAECLDAWQLLDSMATIGLALTTFDEIDKEENVVSTASIIIAGRGSGLEVNNAIDAVLAEPDSNYV